MRVLLRNAWWAYYGICIMASDIIPSDTLLADERNNLKDLKYRHGSINELTILNMFISYFDRGLFWEKKHREYFVRYMAETLSAVRHIQEVQPEDILKAASLYMSPDDFLYCVKGGS